MADAKNNGNENEINQLTWRRLLSTSNKTAYAFLREKFKDIPSKQQIKWCESLQISSNFINWKAIYENNYFSTTETKLRSFQIRLNLRSIVTNIQLAGFDIIDNELCTFCLQHPETINHLFLNCKIVEHFWKDIEDWISTKLRVNIVLSSVNKLFGFQEKGVGFQFLNSLLLSARFLMYRCKYSNTKPNMLQYFNSLSITKQTEYIIAKKKSN